MFTMAHCFGSIDSQGLLQRTDIYIYVRNKQRIENTVRNVGQCNVYIRSKGHPKTAKLQSIDQQN